MYPLTLKLGSRANPRNPWSNQAPTSSLMSRSREKEESLGSLNQTRPSRSQTNIRPVASKVTPTAELQPPAKGPGMSVSVNPGGTSAAESSYLPIPTRQHATIHNHFIAAVNLV